VDRIGLRLQLRKRQAAAGDIVLLYGDESEALTHPYLCQSARKRDPLSASKRDPVRCGLFEIIDVSLFG